MSCTVTEERTRSQPVLVLRLRKELDLLEEVDRLVHIVRNHMNMTDPLSRKLTRCIARCSKILLQKTELGETEFISLLAQKIHEMCSKILVSKMDYSALKNPMLVNGEEVWEEWMLSHYQTLSHYSPFSGERFTSQVPHQLALEIIREIDLLRQSESPEVLLLLEELRSLESSLKNTAYLNQELMLGLSPREALHEYNDLASLSLFTEGSFALTELADKNTIACKKEAKRAKERADQDVEKIKGSLEDLELFLVEELETIRETFITLVSDLEGLLDGERAQNISLEQRISALEDNLYQLQVEIRSLNDRLRSAEERNAQNAQAIQNCSSRGGGCVIN